MAKVITSKAITYRAENSTINMIARANFRNLVNQSKTVQIIPALRFSSDAPAQSSNNSDNFLKYGMYDWGNFEVRTFENPKISTNFWMDSFAQS